MENRGGVYLKAKQVDKNVYELAIERINYLYSKFDKCCNFIFRWKR